MTTRRLFLKKSAAGTLALSFPSILTKAQDKKLGVALVGLGYYSRDLLAPALQLTKHCELRGIVTGTPSKIPTWQKKYGIPDANVYNYDNMHQAANNPDIDIMYIVVPTGLHARYSIVAANAGKHVWCEKPMAKTVAECQSIIDACRKNNRFLSIGYRMQHEPNTQTLMKWAISKPYGDLKNVQAKAGYFDSRTDHWKQGAELGGGALYDMGVYPINAVRYTTGMEPVAVTAKYDNKRTDIYTEVDETTIFSLEFPGGITADCITSLGMGMNILRAEAANGWYQLEPFQSYSGIRGTTSDGKQLNAVIPNQQALQMDNDALAIINKKAAAVPGEEGLRDINIVQKTHESAQNGSKRILLS